MTKWAKELTPANAWDEYPRPQLQRENWTNLNGLWSYGMAAKNADKPEIHGGFAFAHWDGSAEVEAEIKDELKVTIRCIPFDSPEEDGVCVWSGRPSKRRVLFAKSY